MDFNLFDGFTLLDALASIGLGVALGLPVYIYRRWREVQEV